MAEEKGISGKTVATGALAGLGAIGVWKLIESLKAEGAPPEGVQVITPDTQTKEAIAAMLALLADVSTRLGDTNGYLASIDAALAAMSGISPIPEQQYTFRATDIADNLVITGNSFRTLFETTAPDQGALLRIRALTNSRFVSYEIYVDGLRWVFNVDDMINESIDHPHFPGGWIEKATGGQFTFMFSGGESMLYRYWTKLMIVARATTAANVTLLKGDIVDKIFVL